MSDKQTAPNVRIGKGKPGPGRPVGSLNKTTATAKQAIEATFNALEGTPDKNLTAWATANPDDFYKHVWVKILPKNLDLTTGGKALTVDERLAKLAAIGAAIQARK